MNTKMIIGVAVGSFLIFLWQFLSWTVLNLHGSQQKYTAEQDAILQFLAEKLPDEGAYFLPSYPPGTSNADAQKMMEASGGKPWAQISYHKAMKNDMGMSMAKGFAVDIVAVILLVWLLGKIPECTIGTAVLVSVAVGLIGYLTTEYTTSIWFETNSIPDLIDAVVSWTICGTWLGYWMNR